MPTNHDLLITACEQGNVNEVVRLIEEEQVNFHNNQNLALRQAAYHGQLAVVRILVERGADIAAKNHDALTCAATCHSNNRLIDGVNPKQGNLDVVNYLLENGANLEIARINNTARWNSIMDNAIRARLRELGYTI